MLIVVRIMFALRKCFGLFSVYTSLDNFLDCLVSWWWIFFRIVAIVNIIRNRGDPKLALQFLTLKVGLIIECVLLGWFFFNSCYGTLIQVGTLGSRPVVQPPPTIVGCIDSMGVGCCYWFTSGSPKYFTPIQW